MSHTTVSNAVTFTHLVNDAIKTSFIGNKIRGCYSVWFFMFSNFLLSCQRDLAKGDSVEMENGRELEEMNWVPHKPKAPSNSTRDSSLDLNRSMQVFLSFITANDLHSHRSVDLHKELNNFWFHHMCSKQSPITSINLAIHNSCNLGGQQSHVSRRRGQILGTCTEKIPPPPCNLLHPPSTPYIPPAPNPPHLQLRPDIPHLSNHYGHTS